ncbi:F-box/kelch-repeat protein [Vitis vinifera]|uniref:F-box/kelch-repeat protein n=1 Tax=Vitis vinifera TaxID=29760 RepID=A0A438H076_VITVI|nr:F-box/kelch-repeat protein [Vitis vinifera]
MKCPTLAYRVTLLDLETGNWSELPPVPGFSDGLPMFCQLVGVESELVVVGGWDPDTWEISSSVFIYNFLSATCGGERICQNALKSALVYDVAKDEWAPLPDMARERDECKGVFHRGKFHVIGGYCTEMQGRFERSAEAFDLPTGSGTRQRRISWQSSTCRGPAWTVVTWDGKLLVMGCRSFGEAHVAYMLDLKSQRWRKLVAAEEFCGHVQSGAVWRSKWSGMKNEKFLSMLLLFEGYDEMIEIS